MPIACVHIPRFAVEAERQRQKNIASRLILIGEAVVFDCSLGAETSNVKRGMRMSEAIGLCHQAVVLPPDVPYYQRCFDEVLDTLAHFSPEVEASSLGIAYISLLGLPVDPESFAEDLIAELHRKLGFMASVGVANGKFISRIAATLAPLGATKRIPPGAESAFLSPVPVGYLPASKAMHWRLSLLGLTTIGDIARLPLGAVQAQFGPEGKSCWEIANGIDNELLVTRVKEQIITRRLQMPAPSATLEAILMAVERLLYSAYASRERSGRSVRKAMVRAALDGGGAWELAVPFREALVNPRDAWFVVKGAITRRPPERPAEELEIDLVGLNGESGKQAAMFEGKGKLWRQIEETLRQLRAQQGQAPIGKAVEVEPWSRIPERRTALLEFDP
jgi:DNA polymerase-4/protein ImuB